MQINAGREGAAAAGDHTHRHAGVLRRGVELIAQRVIPVGREGIELVRSVEQQRAYPSLIFSPDGEGEIVLVHGVLIDGVVTHGIPPLGPQDSGPVAMRPKRTGPKRMGPKHDPPAYVRAGVAAALRYVGSRGS